MCGRFSFSPNEIIIEERFDIEIEEGLYTPRYNCAPSQNLAVVSNENPERLSLFRWGLIPFWAKDKSIGNKLINARAETILEKASFKTPIKKRRCLVLSDGFYEWKKERTGKQPYRIHLKSKELFAMAGIWDVWKDPEGNKINSFSIVTTEANERMMNIHHRMPVILHREQEDEYLRSDNTQAVVDILKPFPSESMDAYRISSLVNSPRNDSAEVMEPV